MAEDLDDHRRIFNPCPEPDEAAALIFKMPPQLGQCSMVVRSDLATFLFGL
jgi:hypothetical protein